MAKAAPKKSKATAKKPKPIAKKSKPIAKKSKAKPKKVKATSKKLRATSKELKAAPIDGAKRSAKPSKAELKSVIEELKKDARLILVRKALKYVPFYLKSEGLTKKLLKEIIRLWAEAGEKVRVVCLLCLIRVYIKLNTKEKRQQLIKQLYTSFLEKARITKRETMSMIGFMHHSLIELYKLDTEIAFKQSQASCQQLSVTLKNAMKHKNEETYKTVLNWQFANCLKLLSNLITSQDHDSPVKALTHQVIQMNLGAINFLTSPRYYPYYCHLIDNLIGLSIHTNTFIPVLPHLIGILEKLSMPISSKKNVEKDEDDEADAKEYNMDLLNHVSLDETHTMPYQIAVLDKVYDLILKYLASQCHKIAFPELVLLPCVRLKKWLKRNPGQPAQKFKTLLEKIKSDSEKVESIRRDVDFAFTNYSAVDAWEKRLRDTNKLGLPALAEKLSN